MKKYSAILITAILCMVCLSNCTASESAIQTAIASTAAYEEGIRQETQAAEAVAQKAIPGGSTPSGIYIDLEGDTTYDLLDILKVETFLEGENLSVTFFLANIPEEITINTVAEGFGEYGWGVEIDVDQNADTGTSGYQSMTGRLGIDYDMSLFHFSWGGEEKTGPIESVLAYDAQIWKPSSDGQGMESSGTASFTVDYNLNTISLKGKIPGINEGSLLYFHTEKEGMEDSLGD